MNGKASKWRTLNNGLAQGSVLAPKLFNLYMSDIPPTASKQIQYADDLLLLCEAQSFETIETTLTTDLNILNNY